MRKEPIYTNAWGNSARKDGGEKGKKMQLYPPPELVEIDSIWSG